ncbi:OsmC family protein [Paenibacillus spongiae]|uniref:OsmC family protein n=1 Tax=Paenibacillus spongiae TaxID=2909671 RepID=A0ABY5SB31_9BACL|nr:OsmC family protein [Paenibacillus spongiae]UVI30740.1 OsmC family protein [Paenibacillus spongiae]
MSHKVTVNWDNGSQYEISNDQGYKGIGRLTPGEDGLSPIELLSSSLALCVSISLVKLMEKDSVDAGKISVAVEAFKAKSLPSRVERFEIIVSLPGIIGPDYADKLIHEAERVCTIGTTLKVGVRIETEAHSY